MRPLLTDSYVHLLVQDTLNVLLRVHVLLWEVLLELAVGPLDLSQSVQVSKYFLQTDVESL